MGQNTQVKAPRDSQALRVYTAEELASKRVFKTVWTPTLGQEKVIDLINFTIAHPDVVDRLGKVKRNVGVIFGEKSPKGRAAKIAFFDPEEMDLYLSPKACTPMSVLHEVSHIYSFSPTEPHHSPAFAAVVHHLWSSVYGKKAGGMLLKTYKMYGVKVDFDYLDIKAYRSDRVTRR